MSFKLGKGNALTWPFGDFFEGKDAESNPYGQLNPEQKTVVQTLGPYLNKQIGKEQPQYTGNYSADYTPLEQENLNRQNALAGNVADWSDQFQPGKVNPEVDATEWGNLNQKFYGNGINPGAKALAEEQYAGSSGYWGTPRANAVMNEYNASVVDPYRNIRSGLLQNSYQNALNYATGATGVNQATGTMAAVPRAIKQYGLEQKYNEWIRTRPENQKYIDQALTFLGIGTKTTTPAEKSMFEQLLPEAVKGLSTAAGAAMFA